MDRRRFFRTLLGGFAAAATVPLLPFLRPPVPFQTKHYKVWVSTDPTYTFGFTGFDPGKDQGTMIAQLQLDLSQAAKTMRDQFDRDLYLHGQHPVRVRGWLHAAP